MLLPPGGYLALDTGTTTGWAYRPPSSCPIPDCGSFTAGWEDCSEVQACGSFNRMAEGKILQYKPTAIAIESPILLPRDRCATVTRLHGIVGAARALAYRYGLKDAFFEYSHQRIKIHATGNQHAKKEAMMQAATDRGWVFPDDDGADALWILDLLYTDLTRRVERAAGVVS